VSGDSPRQSSADRASPLAPIGRVSFTAAPPSELRSGLVGFVCCDLAGLVRLDGIAVRRTLGGELRLSFPSRRDRAGREHHVVRPLDSEAREAIETSVFEALRLPDQEAER